MGSFYLAILAAASIIAQQAPSEKLPSPVLVTSERVTDREACEAFQAMADSLLPEMPKAIDAITRLDGLVVFCGIWTLNYSKFISVKAETFRDGWRARKEAQWNHTMCDNPELAALTKRGWRFTETLTFISGERFVNTAVCQ